MPSTEYTEEILNFMNKGSFKLEEEPPVKPEIPNCINIGLVIISVYSIHGTVLKYIFLL